MSTEAQAREKWCPMARAALSLSGGGVVGILSGTAINRTDTGLPVDRCIASDCMMWRWSDPEYERLGESEGRRNIRRRGYCGLAGKPKILPMTAM